MELLLRMMPSSGLSVTVCGCLFQETTDWLVPVPSDLTPLSLAGRIQGQFFHLSLEDFSKTSRRICKIFQDLPGSHVCPLSASLPSPSLPFSILECLLAICQFSLISALSFYHSYFFSALRYFFHLIFQTTDLEPNSNLSFLQFNK